MYRNATGVTRGVHKIAFEFSHAILANLTIREGVSMSN
jgi:hypothetical protein